MRNTGRATKRGLIVEATPKLFDKLLQKEKGTDIHSKKSRLADPEKNSSHSDPTTKA